jgi:hypothetical protein
MTTAYPITEIEKLKRSVEVLYKTHHIEILKIIKQFSDIKINENKSGVYINLTFLPKDALDKINEYLEYINGQEQILETVEIEKVLIKTQIDTIQPDDNTNDNQSEKEDKDNLINRYSYIFIVK